MKLTKEEVLAKEYVWQLHNAKEYADYLVYSSYWLVRRHVIIHGNDTHRSILVNDKDWTVREYVAIYGNDAYRDILVHDEDCGVRELVAKYGNDAHRDILVHDISWRVRYEVAKYGNDSHRDFLANVDVVITHTIIGKYMGSTYHKVETDFGTYNGILSLWVWADKYEIVSGCYETNDLEEWFNKCESQLDTATATKYTNIMKDIIGGNQNEIN